jgi:hypothetical protein
MKPPMPTSKGRPTKGDRLKHLESGLVLVVVKREGSGDEYYVIVRCEGVLAIHFSHPMGYPEDHLIIGNMGWMLLHHLFEYERIEP